MLKEFYVLKSKNIENNEGTRSLLEQSIQQFMVDISKNTEISQKEKTEMVDFSQAVQKEIFDARQEENDRIHTKAPTFTPTDLESIPEEMINPSIHPKMLYLGNLFHIVGTFKLGIGSFSRKILTTFAKSIYFFSLCKPSHNAKTSIVIAFNDS